METVHFIFYRKPSLSGALVPFQIYINGCHVGTIKNGGTLKVDVPRADLYYLEDDNPFEKNAVIYDCGLPEYSVLLRRVGAGRLPSHIEFRIRRGHQSIPLPSFHFDKYREAIFGDNFDDLSFDERLLALCLEFGFEIMDDIQEVLASEHLTEMIDALRKAGAVQYADLIAKIVTELFPDTALPLNDDQLQQLSDRIHKANTMVWKSEASAWSELRMCVVRHITGRLSSRDHIY